MKRTNLPIVGIKKYGGRQVAISGGQIIASGINTKSVLRQAKRILPQAVWREILLASVPKRPTVIYCI